MSDRYPCGTLKRRGFLGAAAVAAASPWLAGKPTRADGPAAVAGATAHGPKVETSKFDLPGLYPGRVVEVQNRSMIQGGRKDRAAIKASLDRGLASLTGADDAVEAWKTFFEPGDVVGIKVVPNGYPHAFSSHELVLETIEGLKAAGVKATEIFVYERFRSEMNTARYHEILPEGVRWGGLTAAGARRPRWSSRASRTIPSPATTATPTSRWTSSTTARTRRTTASIDPIWANC